MTSPAPLPPTGMRVRLAEPTIRCLGGTALLSTSSGTMVRLLQPARQVLDDGGREFTVQGVTTAALARALLDRGLADPVWPARASQTLDDVAVVIPVRDRARQLERLLASLEVGTVIVVDDGSADQMLTRRIARGYGATVVRHETARGPAAARNSGLAAAETEFVAFIDSDVVPEPGALSLLRAHLNDPAVAAVGPRVLALDDDDGWIARYERVRSSLDLGARPGPVAPGTRLSYLSSATLMVRRSAAADGFSAGMPVAEDVDLIWRLTGAGWRVRYAPEARVRHQHRVRLSAWLRRKAFYGSGAALLARRHRRLGAPLRLSPANAVLGATLLLQLPGPAALAVAAIFVETARRMVRRTPSAAMLVTAARLTLMSTVSTTWQIAAALTRHYWPLAVLLAVFSPRIRRAVLIAAVGEGILDYRRSRPELDPAGYLVAHRLDDLAYGAGLWLGAFREGSIEALVPDWRPLRRG